MRMLLSLLTVGLALGLVSPAGAGPARAAKAGATVPSERIFIDTIGELEVPEAVILEFVPDGVWALVRVNGQTFWLDLSGSPDFAAKVGALKGKKVAVTGWLEYRATLLPIPPDGISSCTFRQPLGDLTNRAPVIIVSSLEPVEDAAAEPVVRAEITGTIRFIEPLSFPPVREWEITAEGQTYRLRITADELRSLAKKFAGQTVVVSGTLQNGVVVVSGIEGAPSAK